MTPEVKFVRTDERSRQLAPRPEVAGEIAQAARRGATEESDRTYAMGLAILRQAAQLTQVELARRMGATPAALSRIETPHDLLLSTLNAYIQSVGGRASVVLRFADGHETEIDLSRLG